jgi:hypothetical protein
MWENITARCEREVREAHTVVFPKEGPMRFAEQASRSNKFGIFWATDYRNEVFFGPRGVPMKLAFLGLPLGILRYVISSRLSSI